MAAAKLSRTSSLTGNGPGSLSKTRGILIETMQLVETSKAKTVPDHLLDTKVYSKIAQNSTVQARPAVVHFGGFEPGSVHRQVLQLGNVSTEVQRMHIIPPQTNYFDVKYTKSDRLVPGLTLDCVIEFYPDEWRYYYDCIRIHTPGEENLVIPIHAYPIMNTSDFPDYVTFPPVPVGHAMSKILPLRCQAPIDFEFQLTFVQPHPAFAVDPMSGVVPANGEVDITVTFSPSEFSTARMKLQLVISQFNAKPLVCTFTGSSAPGLAKKLSEGTVPSPPLVGPEGPSVLDPRAISPLDRARHNRRRTKKQLTTSRGTLLDDSPQEIEYAGIKFPINLDTPYAVAQVLNQEPGKLRIKDLREVVLSKKGGATAATRQMKEAMFEMAVRQDVYEERQNQLRWQVKLGDDQITQAKRSDILEDRETAWREYKLRRGDPVMEVEYGRTCSDCTYRRTRRDFLDVAADIAQFDTYTNDMWSVRHSVLSKFQQAARKIIIRNRAELKLQSLRQLMIDWGNKKYAQNVTADEKEKMMGESEIQETVENTYLQPERVTSFKFPTYVPPNVKDDMAVDALGKVACQPTVVEVKKKVPYFNLKVPQQYHLMGYKTHSVHEASLNYVQATMMRSLRSGAEDELITIPAPDLPEPVEKETEPVNEGDLRVEDLTEAAAVTSKAEIVPLKPPSAIFRPIDYPPLHIFNPAPGLQVFQPPLPYAETDADFHLCPLPRYTSTSTTNPHMSTQKHYLDKEDTIKGIMSWKRFPSQGLTSLSNTPTLTSVWVPRWTDPFGSNLLPEEVPLLHDSLPEEDKENVLEEEDGEMKGSAPVLTPEMVNAEFSLIKPSSAPPPEEKARKEDMFPHGNKMPPTNIPVSASGPVPRERRENELEFFLKKKYNRLGTKFQSKIDGVNALKTNPNLVLK